MRGRSSASHPATKPSPYSLYQIPPLRYELIEADLHRGSYPTLRNFAFLARLHLRTIVSLTPEPPTPDLAQLCSHYRIALRHYAVPYSGDALAVPAAVVADVLGAVLCRSALPAYVHCLDGRYVSGAVVGVLRRLQHWRVESCVAEYERMCGAGSGEALRELLSEWSEPVRLNSQLLPSWLWNGKWCTHHPTMALLDASDVQRSGEIVEITDIASAGLLTTGDKKKSKPSHTNTHSSTPPTSADTATASPAPSHARLDDDPSAALLAHWTPKRRSWLYYDTLLPSQPLAVPLPAADATLYSVDGRVAGVSAYVECLMLEGCTMTNTFPRPLPLLHVASTTAGASAAGSAHLSSSEQLHSGAHAHS